MQVKKSTSPTRSKSLPPKLPKRLGLDGHAIPKLFRLRASRVSQQTLDRYQHRIAEFYVWAKFHKKKITDDNLDSRVVDYITWVAEHDDPSDTSRGAYLIYGLQLLRCKVAKSMFLPCAKESLASWKRHFPGSMQLPVPEEIIFDLAVSIGNSRLDVALLMLVQFDACLRPSEALQLCKAHVVQQVGYNRETV